MSRMFKKLKSVVKKPVLRLLGTSQEDFWDLRQMNALSQISQQSSDSSFADERKTLEDIVDDIGLQNGFVVDVAASDGFTQSSTLGLFSRTGWSGLAVEMDPNKFSKLSFLYRKFESARLARTRVTPYNIVSLLNGFEAPRDFDVLNLDIDSYDYFVLREMLKSEFRPKIISAEINEKTPPGIFFSVNFDEYHYWVGDHFFGCSIDAISTLVVPFGYILLKVEWNNAIFVREDCVISGMSNKTPQEAYDEGYRNRAGREAIFWWNKDVNYWLGLPENELVEVIAQHFERSSGMYTLHATK